MKAEGETCLRDYSQDFVTVDLLCYLDAVDQYMWPKVNLEPLDSVEAKDQAIVCQSSQLKSTSISCQGESSSHMEIDSGPPDAPQLQLLANSLFLPGRRISMRLLVRFHGGGLWRGSGIYRHRFWAEINGFTCDLPLPDPDDADWDAEVDTELMLDLERGPEVLYKKRCPQCNRTCTLRDVRKIYASRVAAVDDEAQKLQVGVTKKLNGKVEAELRLQVNKLKKKIANMESTTMGAQRLSNVAYQEQYKYIPGHKIYQEYHGQALSCSFRHVVNGGRVFDIDGGRQILLLSRRLSGVGGTFVLTQMNLHSVDLDDMLLPPTTRAIKDLHISPSQ